MRHCRFETLVFFEPDVMLSWKTSFFDLNDVTSKIGGFRSKNGISEPEVTAFRMLRLSMCTKKSPERMNRITWSADRVQRTFRTCDGTSFRRSHRDTLIVDRTPRSRHPWENTARSSFSTGGGKHRMYGRYGSQRWYRSRLRAPPCIFSNGRYIEDPQRQ